MSATKDRLAAWNTRATPDPLSDPRVKALVEAAKPFVSQVQNADFARQLRQHETLVDALRAIEEGGE